MGPYGGFTLSVFCTVFVSGTFVVFNVVREKYNRNPFRPFLNGKKNDAKKLSVNKAYLIHTITVPNNYISAIT